MENVNIRKAVIADFTAVQKLCDELIRFSNIYDPNYNLAWSFEEDGIKYLTSRITGTRRVCFVAEREGQLVGYVTGAMLPVQPWRPYKRAEVENLYIMESFRHKGIGKQLISEFKKWAKGKHATRCMVVAEANDEHALSFYKRNVFKPLHMTLESLVDEGEK